MSLAMPRFTWQSLTLQLRDPFGLSYGTTETRRAYWLRLAGDEGWGEEAIPPYYGVTEAALEAYWQAAANREEPFPEDLGGITAWVGEDGPAPARCALDLALHDRLARRAGVPLYRLLDLPAPKPLPTSFTVSISSPEEMARQAAAAAVFPIIKVKLGSSDDAARLAAVRAARPDARLRVDANAGWLPLDAVDYLDQLAHYGIEMIEQPVARDDFEGLAYVQAHTELPVIADESVRTPVDLERLAALGIRGVNLKLQKAGGIGPALAMLRRARELGLAVMLGCMIETSLGVTAVAHLAGLADWLDLDAPLLIDNDPFTGLSFDETACLHLPDRPGIGAALRDGHR